MQLEFYSHIFEKNNAEVKCDENPTSGSELFRARARMDGHDDAVTHRSFANAPKT
jgi:hypothetical protein